MKVIIIGAGELGRLLASTLCAEKHDVVIVDSSFEELDGLTDKLDVMTVEGSCASVATLKKAGAETANALLAVSGDEASNILSCQIASKLGIQNTICRLYSSDCFSERDGIGPAVFGIWRTFSPPEESVRNILDVLSSTVVMEKIRFSNRDAVMTVFEVSKSSMLSGIRVKDIPQNDLLRTVRLAALVRDKQFLIPHGDTILVPGDKLYVAGHVKNVDAFLDWLAPENERFSRIVISGSDDTGRILANEVSKLGCEVRMIENDLRKEDKLLDEIPAKVMLIHGDPTDEEVLDEAGVPEADVFISVAPDDEDNILSCIMAKRLGVKKVVSLTHKPEYIRIVPALQMIDCGFSATLVSVNAVLRLLEGGMMRVDAILQRFNAHLSEYRVLETSPLCGRKLSDCVLPGSLVLALVFRGAEVITPSGDTVLQKEDIAVAIVTCDAAKEVAPLFPQK